MEEGLIALNYECSKCNERMGSYERKSAVLDGDFEWVCSTITSQNIYGRTPMILLTMRPSRLFVKIRCHAVASTRKKISNISAIKRNHKETTDRSWLDEPTSAKTLTTDPIIGSVDWIFADLGQRSVTDWRRVIFSDESRFSLSADDHRTRVWRRTGQRSDPAFIVERHTAISQGVTVWGAISWDTRSSLVVLQGTLTARRYVDDILTPIVLPMLSSRPGAIYQQDNARPHTARLSQQCLQGYDVLPWPARTPDLSPIEHVWTRWEVNCSRPEIQEN
ncbi:HTH_Tnp_Tc3_2 domain-containing protein [Trichonephila clavipes]|nr:HTH_Tnp_Tc3_2 domain-containing protein [Trichonephila clavipes]